MIKNLKFICIVLLVILNVVYGGSSKKGVCFGYDNASDSKKCGDLKTFDVSWYYNWDKQPSCQASVSGIEFIPMIAKSTSFGGNIAQNDWILAFNEPNYIDQSNLTPLEAANLWPQIQDLKRKNVLAGLADCGGSGGGCTYSTNQWVIDFMGNCSGCKVDAVAVHHYYCNAQDTINKINSLHSASGNLPIWLTEFACSDSTSYTQTINFAKELLPLLEKSIAVEKYSWFIHWCRNCPSSLLYSSLLYDNGTLTPIGEYYSSFASTKTNITTSSSSNSSNDPSTSSKLFTNYYLFNVVLSIFVVLYIFFI